jgi:RND family efflux transporter MFP subunit
MKILVLAFSLMAGALAAEPALFVSVTTVQETHETRRFSLVGEIVARHSFAPSFPMSGRIAEVMVQEGDTVAAGTPLARIEAVQQEQALLAAQAGLVKAQADHSQYEKDLERQGALLERGATTRIEQEAAQDALNISAASLTQAIADLDRAQRSLEDTVLHASSSAKVIERMIETGQVVGAAQQVFELALGDDLDAVFEVPETLLNQKGKSEVVLSVLDRPDDTFSGHVREVSPFIDDRTGTVTVKVSVSEPPSILSYGEAVRGTTEVKGGVRVVLPYSALSATQDGPAIWIVDPQDNSVDLMGVEIDRFETGKIVLMVGVPEGSLVVTQGAQLLYPGRVVSYLEALQ